MYSKSTGSISVLQISSQAKAWSYTLKGVGYKSEMLPSQRLFKFAGHYIIICQISSEVRYPERECVFPGHRDEAFYAIAPLISSQNNFLPYYPINYAPFLITLVNRSSLYRKYLPAQFQKEHS